METIPVSGPWVTEKEIEYVTDAARNAWYGNANFYNEKFEKTFSEYIGVKFSVSLPSCTSAIHLSLLALGVGPGDEVIVPDITWIATAAPITYVGAEPVFADIDPNTWCLSVEAMEECITPRTKAVIPVDLYGNVPDWDAILGVAEKYGVAIIEDAAEAIGSMYRGKRAGGFGETGVFSFHGSKTMTTGEGGMLVTDSSDIYRRVLFLRDHGREPGDTMFLNREVAYKYKMSSLQAAFGLAQLERMEELVDKKRRIFSWYRDALGDIEGISLNYEDEDTLNTFWMVTATWDSRLQKTKDQIIKFMAEKGISCRPFFSPLSSIPAYVKSEQAKLANERNLTSYSVSPYGVNLPSGMNMNPQKVEYVCDSLRSILVM